MGAPLQIDQAVPAAESRPDDTAQEQQYLTFLLGQETYAMGILAIKEIIEYGHLTAVPMVPRFIRGVINLKAAVSAVSPAAEVGLART